MPVSAALGSRTVEIATRLIVVSGGKNAPPFRFVCRSCEGSDGALNIDEAMDWHRNGFDRKKLCGLLEGSPKEYVFGLSGL